ERPGCRVLDGFAGTGALGLEAISRGAAHVTFIDDARRAVEVIAANVARGGAADRCIIERGDFIGVAVRLRRGPPFDLVLLDPPYDFPDVTAVVEASIDLVGPGGLIVLEHARRRQVSPPARTSVSRTVIAAD